MKDLHNFYYLETNGKSSKKLNNSGKSFGYQVLGFGSGGAAKPPYIIASGGTITCSGNFKIHTFTGPGTFCVSSAGAAAPCSGTGSNVIDYLVVAGGGGGVGGQGGAGGAGGYRESPGTASGCYTVSPRGASPAAALPVTVTGYPVAVGGGGAAANPNISAGTVGTDSVFTGSSTITSTGGGGGGAKCDVPGAPSRGLAGGSGGGNGACGPTSGGPGNNPPVSPAQGMNGGNQPGPTSDGTGGGGGGAITVGGNGGGRCAAGGAGGAGATSSINATPTARSGGGGAGGGGNPGPNTGGSGGSGGGGTGGGAGGATSAGTCNTGGGGGGGGNVPAPVSLGAAGGSGIVIIRYKYQN